MILLLSGFDPTGHAGILRDIQICQISGRDFFPLITAFTFQTDKKYFGTCFPPQKYFENFLRHVNVKKIKAVKIGMLGDRPVVLWVLKLLKKIKTASPKTKIVWDPVFESSSRGKLLTSSGRLLAQKKLIPCVDVVTPNIPEARIMTASKNTHELCESFFKRHRKPIYLKGGHLQSKSKDYFYDGKILKMLSSKSYPQKIRGTGCIFSTRLACHLASGESLPEACRNTKKFMNDIFSGKIKI